MNGNILRRRMASGKSEETFKIEHSGYWYFETTTTSANNWLYIWYATNINSYYLDGVKMSSNDIGYSDGFGKIKIPTAGTHKIWVKPSGWDNNSKVARPNIMNCKVLYVGSNIKEFTNQNNILETLYVTSSTPPTAPAKNNNYKKLAHIYIPKDKVNTYKSSWTNWASIIEGIKFK